MLGAQLELRQCASRVFLTESVVQHLFELQGLILSRFSKMAVVLSFIPLAIARIDRMGQTRPTEGARFI